MRSRIVLKFIDPITLQNELHLQPSNTSLVHLVKSAITFSPCSVQRIMGFLRLRFIYPYLHIKVYCTPMDPHVTCVCSSGFLSGSYSQYSLLDLIEDFWEDGKPNCCLSHPLYQDAEKLVRVCTPAPYMIKNIT